VQHSPKRPHIYAPSTGRIWFSAQITDACPGKEVPHSREIWHCMYFYIPGILQRLQQMWKTFIIFKNMKRKFKQWWSTVPVILTKHWKPHILVKWCGNASVFHLWVKCQHITHGGVRVADLFFLVLLCVFMFWVPCCDVRCDFRIKRCSVRLYLQVFVGGFGS